MACRFRNFLVAFTAAVLLPSAVYAQASLTGTVKDTSGAILPGVTVEAASPVLIEKVRSGTTDSSGRFRIIDLRPGIYTVTFTLTGFSTVKREGVGLAGASTMVVDAELKVGSLAETVTVTGESALLDVQSATRETVMNREVVQALPTGRNYYHLGGLITGVNVTSNSGVDVGGNLGDTMASLMAHGGRAGDQRITNNGINVSTLESGGNSGGATPDVSGAAEVTVDTSAVSADQPTGGVRVNMIPRDGGNRFASSSFFTFTNESLEGSNLTDSLKSRGLTNVSRNINMRDINPAFGGPIMRDKVWFWASMRDLGTENEPVGAFVNGNAYQADKWLYAPTTEEAHTKGVWHGLQSRFTIQANDKNKFALTWQQQNYCRCPEFIGATVAPEAASDRRFPRLQQQHGEWSSPVTDRILLEVVGMHLFERWTNGHLQFLDGNFFQPGGSLTDASQQAAQQQLIQVQEQSTGMIYRAGPFNQSGQPSFYQNTLVPNWYYRAAMSYVTGTHNLKIGFNRSTGYLDKSLYRFQPVQYRFNNGVPNQVTLYAAPLRIQANEDNDLGIFAQDRVTFNRVTVAGGLRFDSFQTSFPDQPVEPSPLAPNRNFTFPAQDSVNWKDITYRSSISWDVRGDGKTAVKATLNKYLASFGLGGLTTAVNPINTMVNSTTRSWSDANGNFIPDCDLISTVANGECGPMANTNFGKSVPGATFDPKLLTGWGHRQYNWEFSASFQQEILPRVTLDVGYFRRWFGNFQVTDDLAISASDFDQFSLTVPNDPTLGANAGKTLTGLFNLKPSAFGRPAQLYNTLSDDYGNMIEHWNGIDISVNARLASGVMVQGGISTGKRSYNFCEISAKIPEYLNGSGSINLGDNNNGVWLPGQFCSQEEPFLTTGRLFGVYTIPKIGVLVSGTLQSSPGPLIAANYTATNAILASSSTLGRALAGNAANVSINIAEPGSMYVERLNEVDFRVGKLIKAGRTKTNVSVDLYNMFNSDAARSVNNSYASWTNGPRPTSVVLGRFAKLSATFDF